MAPGEVPGRGTGQRVDAEEAGPLGSDRHRTVLEREGRVARVVLEPEAVDAESRAEAVGLEERRRADAESAGRRRVDGQELEIAPQAGRPRLDDRAAHPFPDRVLVVRDFERAEAGRADVGGTERLGPSTVATDEADDARRGHDRAARVMGGRLGRWCGRGIDRHRRLQVGAAAGATGPVKRKTLPLREGSQGVPLSRRRTCPDLAPCRLDAGRLSWLQRAGPSATLDKSSSVVRGSYGAVSNVSTQPRSVPGHTRRFRQMLTMRALVSARTRHEACARSTRCRVLVTCSGHDTSGNESLTCAHVANI